MSDSEMKEVSVNQIEKIIKNHYDNSYKEVEFKCGDEVITVMVKPYLTYQEFGEFVQTVVDTCFEKDEITGEYSDYYAYREDFITAICVLKYYTNIMIPKDATKLYPLIYGTDIIDKILDIIDLQQNRDLMLSISQKMEFRRRQVANNKRYSDLYDKLSELEEMLMYFGNIIGDPEEAKNALAAFANMGELTSDNLVKAMREQGVIGNKELDDTPNLKRIK